MSELSSLHDQNTDFCQNFCQARKQMQPPVTDQDIDLAFRAQLVRGSGHFKSKAKRDGECCNSRYNQSNVQSEKQQYSIKVDLRNNLWSYFVFGHIIPVISISKNEN